LKETVPIHTPYITLGQFVKLVGVIDTGGQIKHYLTQNIIHVNGQHEQSRGKKLYPGDQISLDKANSYEIIAAEA
jgi:S4 domain protein YaaA